MEKEGRVCQLPSGMKGGEEGWRGRGSRQPSSGLKGISIFSHTWEKGFSHTWEKGGRPTIEHPAAWPHAVSGSIYGLTYPR